MDSLTFALGLFACLIAVNGHTVQTNVVINGNTYTNCLRPAYPDNMYGVTGMGSQWPIMSSSFLQNGLGSTNYTCGFMPYAGQAAAAKCSVAAGSTIGVTYYHGANSDEDPTLDRFIARSHKGPFLAYLAKSSDGTGNVWFKIFQQGQTQTSTNFNNVKWASPDTLLANNGVMYFTIPSDISPGNYLLRTEIIAMHDVSSHGSQPYVRCTELTVTGGGSANPTGVAIPGAYSYNDPGITYNIYNQFTTAYPFPGPAVYTPAPQVTTGQNQQVTTSRAQVTTGQNNQVTTSRTQATTGQNNNQVTTGRTQATTGQNNNQGTTGVQGKACASNSECASGVCTIDGTCYVSGIPCDENTDCDSGVCTIEGYCLEQSSSASAFAASAFAATALIFF